jgi:hypothetical protein
VSFDGTNDAITMSAKAFEVKPVGTASFWLNSSSYSGGKLLYEDGATYNNFAASFPSVSTDPMSFNLGSNAVAFTTTKTNFALNTWYNVVITWNGTNVITYVNGVLDKSNSSSNAPNTTAGPQKTQIGRYAFGPGPTAGGYFAGKIDEVRIYNRALGATEITNLYKLGAAKVNTSENSLITSGLVGEWSFNGADVSGTTAYDRSGSGNTGTLTNGPAATLGKVGQGMSFDGTNDYMNAPDQGSLSISGNITMSVWVNVAAFPAADPGVEPFGVANIISKKYNGTDVPYYLDIYKSPAGVTKLRVGSYNSSAGDVGTQWTISGWNTSKWHHLVGMYDGSNWAIYFDGVQKSISANAQGSRASALDVTVGGFNNNGTMSRFLNGTIDEPRIYNRALSAAEIQMLYALGDADKVNSSASQPQGTGRLDSGLASYWKLDENTGTSAGDASTNGNTGTLTNGPTWTTGQIGSAVSFDGTNDYLSYASNIAFNSVDFTISTWVKANGVGTGDGTYPIFEQRVDATGNGQPAVTLGFTAAKNLSFVARDNVGAAATYTESTVRNLSQWYHVVAVKTSSAISLYVDGAFIGSTSHSLSGDFDASAVYRDFGRYRYSGIDQSFLNGVIDEPRIYNRALAADEVAQLYQTTVPTSADTSLKGYWSFNGPDISGTTAYDRSGAGNNGTLTSSPTAAIGKAGQALSFNGTTSFVDLGAPTALDLSGVNKFTLSAWVYPTATPNGAGVITEMYTSTVQYTIGFSNNVTPTGNSYPTVGFYNGAWRAITESRAIDLNQWSLITGTWDGTTMNLYRNGALVATGTPGGPMPSADFLKVVIGKRHDTAGTTNFFPGRIDEARIYNRALTATEVLALYNLGR